jgi:hypothetical protein
VSGVCLDSRSGERDCEMTGVSSYVDPRSAMSLSIARIASRRSEKRAVREFVRRSTGLPDVTHSRQSTVPRPPRTRRPERGAESCALR